MLLGDVVGLPDGVLLVHDVAADDASVLIDQYGAVATFADGADGTLRNAYGIVGIGELVAGLLLHVIGYHPLVGNGGPEVLVTVDEDDVRISLYAHLGIDLPHVSLEVLGLRMVDAESCRRLDPQRTLQCFLHTDDVAVGQR